MHLRSFVTGVIPWIIFLASCEKIKYYPDKENKEVKTKILAHRGGGFGPYQENTLDAAKYGMTLLDGIEVDLQISKDRTIWLSHNADLPDCGGDSYDCFPEATDIEIMRLDICNGDDYTFSRLEWIFDFMSSNFPEKYISLDVKAWSPCAATSVGVTGVMNVIADEIIRLTKKYKLQNHIMVESETATILNYLRRNSEDIEIYLTAFGDFERGMLLALQGGYSGISFNYKELEEIGINEVQLIRKKGLKIQLWTVNSEEELSEALSINPDFIQTDNIDFFQSGK